MSGARLHLLSQAALCFEQAGQPDRAARCRERAGEPVAAAELYRAAGELVLAAGCYRSAGRIAEAASCLLALGRPVDAAELWIEEDEAGVSGRLEAAWILAAEAREPQRARGLLTGDAPRGEVEGLRLALIRGMCAALDGRPGGLVAAVREVERRLGTVTPAAERAGLARWAVQGADHVRRPDLAAGVFAAAYRARVRGTAARWREWAARALGGTSGVPHREP